MSEEFEPVITLQCPVDLLATDGSVTIRQDQKGFHGDTVEIYITGDENIRALAHSLLRAVGDMA